MRNVKSLDNPVYQDPIQLCVIYVLSWDLHITITICTYNDDIFVKETNSMSQVSECSVCETAIHFGNNLSLNQLVKTE